MAKNTDMGSKFRIRAMALFLIALVLTLPFTFAASITGVTFDGTIGSGSVVKPLDTVTVSVNVTESSGETLNVGTLNQQLLLGSTTLFTTACTGTITAGKYTCTASLPIPAGVKSTSYGPISVTLYSDANRARGTEQDYTQGSVTVDGEAPTISVSSLAQRGSQVEFTLSGTDTALPANVPVTTCSGFGSISLYWLSGSTQTSIPYTMQPTAGCTYTNTSRVDISSLSTGSRQLCASATDRAGNVGSSSCRLITIDNSKPVISAIDLVTASGSSQYMPAGSGTGFFVTFNATNNDPDGFTVTVNGEEKQPTICNAIGSCKTGPFPISDAGTYTVSVTGKTYQGVAGAPVTKQISVETDDVAPVYAGLTTNLTASTGKNYLVSGVSSIVARFTEAKSGLSNKNAKLLIDGTSIGSPTRCVKTSTSNWDCIWDKVNYVSPVQGNLSVKVSATDLLGNAGAIGNATLIYDTVAPKLDLSTLNITSINTIQDIGTLAASKSLFRISFNVSDEYASPITATVDMTAFEPLNGVNKTSGTCSAKSCALTITTPQVGIGPYSDVASILVSDVVGNNQTYYTPTIDVLKTSNDTNTTYFKYTLSLTPSALELTTFPYISQNAFAKIDVKGIGGAKVLKLGQLQCRNIPVASTTSTSGATTRSPSVGDTRLLAKDPKITPTNSTSQILVGFTFKAISVNQSNIQFLCDFNITGRVGNILIPQEKETVLVNFSTYNLTVGELGANYDAKLKAQTEKAKNHIGGKLATFEKLFKIISQLCNLWRMVSAMQAVLTMASSGVKKVGTVAATNPLPPVTVAGFTILSGEVAWCLTNNVMGATFDSVMSATFAGLCKLATCENTGLLGMLSKAPKSLGIDTKAASLNSGISGSVIQAAGQTETLAGSIIGLCIPGIIRSLRRAQQIECQYAICLRDEVPKGVPVEACDSSYEYSSCVYTTANFFILGAIWDKIINMIKSLVVDPIALAGTIGAAFCVHACLVPGDAGAAEDICVATQITSKIGRIVGMLMGMKSDWIDKNYEAQDYCKRLDTPTAASG